MDIARGHGKRAKWEYRRSLLEEFNIEIIQQSASSS
jgi:hypothetical protein